MLDIIFEQTTQTTIQVLVGAIIGGLISTFVSRLKEHKSLENKIEDLTKAIEETRSDFKKEIEKVRYDLLLEINGLKQAESASLRNVIRHACKSRIRDGFVSLDEKDDILNCYNCYESLVEKNGFVDDIVHRMRELPNENPNEKDN